MKYYDFASKLVLNNNGDWDYDKMNAFLWDLSNAFVPEFGGQNIYPFTKGKSEDFAKENGLFDAGTGPVLAVLSRFLNEESDQLWAQHLKNKRDADEYIRMAQDRNHHGQFIIEAQTYHLFPCDGQLVYAPRSKNCRIYIKYLNYGLDIHYSDRLHN